MILIRSKYVVFVLHHILFNSAGNMTRMYEMNIPEKVFSFFPGLES